MIKYVVAAGMVMVSTVANAASIVSETNVYRTENIYETVEVCTKGDDKTTEGAIIGGLIGSQEGEAGIGAIIGAIIGNEIGEETCTTERRVIGTQQVYIGKDIIINVDGVVYTINHRI